MRLGSRSIVVLLSCILAGTPLYSADKPTTLAVVMDGLNHEERAPLQAYLTKAMGRPVTVASPDSYGEIVSGLADGSYDFACLGALVYIRAHARYGVIPLVQRVIDLHYHSVFITGINSSIHSLNDLRGKQFAFGDIDSTSAHLMAYRELIQAGIHPETDLKYRYSGSHLATAAMVATGVVDAGAMDETVYNFLIATGKLDGKRVRVFYTSQPYIDYVYVARKNISKAERDRFIIALLSLKEGTDKDDVVLKILRANKFVVADDEEYTATRQIERSWQRDSPNIRVEVR